MKLLVLGGTSDAVALSQALIERNHQLIYSIKGIVRQPNLRCEIRTGGFGGVNSLARFLKAHKIDCLVDVSHPYAINISNNAALAAAQCRLSCLHYVRPAWQQQAGDQWFFYRDLEQLADLLHSYKRPFFTIGQLPADFLSATPTDQHCIVRSAIDQKQQVDNATWIKSIGPFNTVSERQLFLDYQIDALVSKNSGGNSVAAKIYIARDLKLPVFMLARPDFNSAFPIVDNLKAMLSAIEAV